MEQTAELQVYRSYGTFIVEHLQEHPSVRPQVL